MNNNYCYKINDINNKLHSIDFSMQLRHKEDRLSIIFSINPKVYHYKKYDYNDNTSKLGVFIPILDHVEVLEISDKIIKIPLIYQSQRKGMELYLPNKLDEYIDFSNYYVI